MPSSNIELLKRVANRLGPLLGEVVFVGGCTTELFITDEAAAEVRPTGRWFPKPHILDVARVRFRIPSSSRSLGRKE